MSRPEFSSLVDPEVVALLERHFAPDRRVHATGLDLRGKVLDGADLDGAILTDCVFDGASLRDVILYDAHPLRCSFRRADLTGVQTAKSQFTDCDLRDVKLVGANLIRASLHGLDLRGADLSAADVLKTFFRRSDLRGVVLRDVAFDRTVFNECCLGEADMAGAHGTVLEHPINVGTPEAPRILEGDEALAWFRDAGADVGWFVPLRSRP